MPVNKVRRNGSYAPLSAHYYKDSAIIAAGERAETLYLRGLAFCADVLSDGFISDRQMPLLSIGLTGVKQRAAALVREGLWERDDEHRGYIVVGWLKWNRSKDEIMSLAEKDVERKRPPGPDHRQTSPRSDRNPTGVQTESDRSPKGFHPRARTPAPAPSPTPRHDTPGSDRTPSGPVRSEPLGARPPASLGGAGGAERPRPAKAVPDLSGVRAKLRDASAASRARGNRREGSALDALRALTDRPDPEAS